jgi:hypothetical protein
VSDTEERGDQPREAGFGDGSWQCDLHSRMKNLAYIHFVPSETFSLDIMQTFSEPRQDNFPLGHIDIRYKAADTLVVVSTIDMSRAI